MRFPDCIIGVSDESLPHLVKILIIDHLKPLVGTIVNGR